MGKKCFIIAGPNGAGKTTFAKDFLPKEADCVRFINADLIAAGLSPFAPEKASVSAGKLMLRQIERYVGESKSFAFETTLSGLLYTGKIKRRKTLGYEVILYYFSLPSVEMAINRVKLRVEQGGHNIPLKDIKRRFERSRKNFETLYKPLVDTWIVFDTSTSTPIIIDQSRDHEQK